MVKLAKTGHDPHSCTLGFICVVRLLFVLCVNAYRHRVTTQLQLINISYHIIYLKTHITYLKQFSLNYIKHMNCSKPVQF